MKFSHKTVDARANTLQCFRDGQPVFKFAVTNMADVSAEIMERTNWAPMTSPIGSAQANKRIIDATARRMGVGPER